MPEYKVIYFAIRGLGEPIRQLLTLAGQPFQDERIPLGTLTPEKKEELGLEWGQLPVLQIDGVSKTQSFAICRYLAKKYGLTGKNEEEEFRCEEIVEVARDFIIKGVPMFVSFFGGDTAKLAEQKKSLEEVDAPLHLGRLDKMLEKKGNIWTVGDSITWADVILVHYVTHFETCFELQLSKGLPSLQKLIHAVQNEPKLKVWLDNRPKTQF